MTRVIILVGVEVTRRAIIASSRQRVRARGILQFPGYVAARCPGNVVDAVCIYTYYTKRCRAARYKFENGSRCV